MEPGDDLGGSEHVLPDIRISGAKFLLLLETRELHIWQATLDKIVGDVKGLWLVSMESIKKDVKECMDTALLDSSSLDINGILKCFDSPTPLDGLETEDRQA